MAFNGVASSGYFSAGTVSGGVLTAGSSLSVGLFSCGFVSIGLFGRFDLSFCRNRPRHRKPPPSPAKRTRTLSLDDPILCHPKFPPNTSRGGLLGDGHVQGGGELNPKPYANTLQAET